MEKEQNNGEKDKQILENKTEFKKNQEKADAKQKSINLKVNENQCVIDEVYKVPLIKHVNRVDTTYYVEKQST